MKIKAKVVFLSFGEEGRCHSTTVPRRILSLFLQKAAFKCNLGMALSSFSFHQGKLVLLSLRLEGVILAHMGLPGQTKTWGSSLLIQAVDRKLQRGMPVSLSSDGVPTRCDRSGLHSFPSCHPLVILSRAKSQWVTTGRGASFVPGKWALYWRVCWTSRSHTEVSAMSPVTSWPSPNRNSQIQPSYKRHLPKDKYSMNPPVWVT